MSDYETLAEYKSDLAEARAAAAARPFAGDARGVLDSVARAEAAVASMDPTSQKGRDALRSLVVSTRIMVRYELGQDCETRHSPNPLAQGSIKQIRDVLDAHHAAHVFADRIHGYKDPAYLADLAHAVRDAARRTRAVFAGVP